MAGMTESLRGLRVFRLRKYEVPKAFRKMRSLRVFAYIEQTKDNGEVIALYETAYEGDPIKHRIFTSYDTELGQETEITKEEFLSRKPYDKNPVIFNLYMHMHFGRMFWVMVHQDNGDAYGFTYGKLWPWWNMLPKEVDDFAKICIDYVKGENPLLKEV